MSDDTRRIGPTAGAVMVLALVLALLVADLIADSLHGASRRHLLLETSAALLAAAGLTAISVQTTRLERQRRLLGQRLAASQADAARWRDEAAAAIGGLRQAIERQLERWQLTPAEREIALLLLQGLGHKQIAARRGASERTVRQQAHMLYRKTGLGGRADLAAFFLGDLFGAPEGDEQ